MNKINIKVGNTIKKIRCSKNWYQSDLAEKSGLPLRTIGRIERAEVDVRLSTLEKISNALKIKLKEILL